MKGSGKSGEYKAEHSKSLGLKRQSLSPETQIIVIYETAGDELFWL